MSKERELEWLLEQIDAAKDIVSTYTCFYCHMATAQEIVMIISDESSGARVQIVGMCGTCGGVDDKAPAGSGG